MRTIRTRIGSLEALAKTQPFSQSEGGRMRLAEYLDQLAAKQKPTDEDREAASEWYRSEWPRILDAFKARREAAI